MIRTLALLIYGLVFFGCRTVDEAERHARIEAWVTEGRQALRAGEPDAALKLFENAAAEEDSLETRIWVLRAWMEQGRSNDTLDAIDALQRDGLTGVELDYLYGMAFAQRARDLVSQGVADTSVRMNFIDAAVLLERVVETAGERFPDAYLSLARAAWSNRDFEQARSAAEGAVLAYPQDGEVWLALGRVALGQFADAQREEKWGAAAQAHWSRGVEALRRAIDVLGTPHDERGTALLARSGLELGHALVWRERYLEAADAYALSIAYAPDAPDYVLLKRLLSPAPAPADETSEAAGEEADPPTQPAEGTFLRALEGGALAFHARVGLDDPRDGTLSWWLGWARYQDGRFATAEKALLASLEKLPEAANAWVYVALSRFALADYPGASRALLRGWEIDAPSVVVEMQRDLELNVARIDWVISKLPETELVERATLSEICAEVAIDEPRHWNNMALFLRDEADRMRAAGEAGPESLDYTALCERSYQAYLRALEITPDDPQLLNDAAVLLHYYLERGYERALQMYELAARLSEAHLANPDLTPGDRERFEIAQRDAQNNQKILREELEGSGS